MFIICLMLSSTVPFLFFLNNKTIIKDIDIYIKKNYKVIVMDSDICLVHIIYIRQ